MARPSNAALASSDPFATKEAMRMARNHLRRWNLALKAAQAMKEDERAALLLGQFVTLWEQCRLAEKHQADLIRNPPKAKKTV